MKKSNAIVAASSPVITIVPGRRLRATHYATRTFADVDVEMMVTEDGTAYFTKAGAIAALIGAPGSPDFKRLVDRIPGKPIGFSVLPVLVSLPKGGTAHGISAEQFTQIVSLYAQAAFRGALSEQQKPIGKRCVGMALAFIELGVTQIIYKALGYAPKKPDVLDLKLAAYLLPAGEKQKYEVKYPPLFFRELYRLWRVKPNAHGGRHPAFFKALIRKYVWDAIDEEVALEIKSRNPDPQYGSAHFQELSDRANRVFEEHMKRLLLLMKHSRDKQEFNDHFNAEFKNHALQYSMHSVLESRPGLAP